MFMMFLKEFQLGLPLFLLLGEGRVGQRFGDREAQDVSGINLLFNRQQDWLLMVLSWIIR